MCPSPFLMTRTLFSISTKMPRAHGNAVLGSDMLWVNEIVVFVLMCSFFGGFWNFAGQPKQACCSVFKDCGKHSSSCICSRGYHKEVKADYRKLGHLKGKSCVRVGSAWPRYRHARRRSADREVVYGRLAS